MSRLTFREQVDVCWQKQLRDKYLSEGTPPVPHLNVKRAIVRPVSRKLAEQIILKYEWLGTMARSTFHYGVFFGSFCAGVCCVAGSIGTGGTRTNETFGISRDELAILVRGACVHWAPKGTNSRLVSWSCRLLRATRKRVLLAYSDTDAGEIGTIYQACNWDYIGRGSATRQWISPKGIVRDQKYPWNLSKTRGGTRARWCKALRQAGWTEQRTNPKHRYVYVLDKRDKALRARVEAMRQPYPKRADA